MKARRSDWDGLVSRLDALDARVKSLERSRTLLNHKHQWRYRKDESDPDSFSGSSTFWSWKCQDELCGESGGTNLLSRLPDDFPESLR